MVPFGDGTVRMALARERVEAGEPVMEEIEQRSADGKRYSIFSAERNPDPCLQCRPCQQNDLFKWRWLIIRDAHIVAYVRMCVRCRPFTFQMMKHQSTMNYASVAGSVCGHVPKMPFV